MSAEYSVEGVWKVIARCTRDWGGIDEKLDDCENECLKIMGAYVALLERIEADESAVTADAVAAALHEFNRWNGAEDERSVAMDAALHLVWPRSNARDKARLSERKTVHLWLNDLHIEREECGRPLCLLRRLRILCDRYFDTCEQLSFEIRKHAAHPPAQAAQADEYAAGWRQAARWAERDDLLADIGSPAYERDKAFVLQAPTAEPIAQAGADGDVGIDCVSHSPDAADSGRVTDADSIAMEAAHEIALMWGHDRSQFVAKIQVRVIAAITAALAAQGQGEPIGEVRENGVTWFRDNPHAFPVGTQFYTTPAASPVGVPEGWKLVPVEPTEQMLDAAACLWPNAYSFNTAKADARADWDAMLAAAPQPEDS